MQYPPCKANLVGLRKSLPPAPLNPSLRLFYKDPSFNVVHNFARWRVPLKTRWILKKNVFSQRKHLKFVFFEWKVAQTFKLLCAHGQTAPHTATCGQLNCFTFGYSFIV